MTSSGASDRELVIERVFDAPRELVFKAWADSEQLEKWWGPEGMTTVTLEHDFTVGGQWRYEMRPEGRPAGGTTSEYLEIVPPEKIVTRDTMGKMEGFPTPEDVTVTVTFEEQGDKTKLTIRILHVSVEDREKNEGMGVQYGWASCLDSLEKYLAETA